MRYKKISPVLIYIKKKKKFFWKRACHFVDFAVQTDQRVKIKETKKIDKYLDLYQRAEKAVEHENDKDL